MTQKAMYRVRNWKEYNASLVNRGDITLWLSEDVLSLWSNPPITGRRGRHERYPTAIIECALTLRALLGLALRATEGFLKNLLRQLNLPYAIPDYTTLCKRQKGLALRLKKRPTRGKSLDIVLDSTGLKVYGEGECKMRQHGQSKRRTWRKLHIALDANTFEIAGAIVTEASCHDGEVLPPLLDAVQGKIKRCWGDGAYDHTTNYDYLSHRHIEAVIPPRKNARITQHGNTHAPPLARDEAIRLIRKHGRATWKKSIGYHRRSLAETMMYCFKTTFGDKLRNRSLKTQGVEVGIKCNILNQFRMLVRPESYKII